MAGLVMACTSQSGAPAGQPPGGSLAAETAKPTAAPTSEPLSREMELLSRVPPTVDAMVEAMEAGDLAAARAAYETYDATWNGIEVYVNFRSKETYDKLEGELQHEIEEGLAAEQPDLEALQEVADELGAEWTKTLQTIEAAELIHPLFDDVATVRIIRADLRIVTSALAAGDLAKARTHWAKFAGNIGPANELIGERTTAGRADLEAALLAAEAAFAGADATVDELKPLVAAVTTSYNFGLSLWNAAARNADATRTTYTDADIKAIEDLNAVAIELARSVTAWESADYAAAATAAGKATEAFAGVKPALAAHNGADVTLETALGAWAEAAGAAGDATAVSAASRAANNAILVAQQVLVGQFWSDADLQAKIAAFPKS